MLDVDDPDFEGVYGERERDQWASFARRSARGRPPVADFANRRAARRVQVITVSNPAMRRWYGHRGHVVPHTRQPRPAGPPHAADSRLRIAFVGTVRPHKGVRTLRAAVARLPNAGLTVTAAAPADAARHETWVGGTTYLSEGLDILDQSDVAVVASAPSIHGRGQLPAKLIDAMMSGRAVVGSAVEPIASGRRCSGMLVPPGDVDALLSTLADLHSCSLRQRLGDAARRRALALFAPIPTGDALAIALAHAMA